jgi:nitrogen regulatory protein PII
MKQIIAVVRPYLAERVLESLRLAPLEAIIVREVKGYNRQKSYLEDYDDTEYGLAFLPKVEITMWVEDFRAEEVLQSVSSVACTGRMGDGKIMVLPLI